MGNQVLLTVVLFLACVVLQASAQLGNADLQCKTYCNVHCAALTEYTDRQNCHEIQANISRCKCNVGYYIGLFAGLCVLIIIFCCCCQCVLRRRQAQAEGHLPTSLLGFPVFGRRNNYMDNEGVYVIPMDPPIPPPKYEDLDKFPVVLEEPPPSYNSLAIECEKA